MRVMVRQAVKGETRWGVFTNLRDADDRAYLGCWYWNLHAGPLHIEVYGGFHARK